MRTFRLRRLALIFVVVVGIMIVRLFQLQIIEHDQWMEIARNSRTGKNSIPFRRGRILDRNGLVLATDHQAYDLFFRYRDFRRGFVAAQLFEALRIVNYPTDGLVDCLDRGEVLGDKCLALRPQDLTALSGRQRSDLRFYLTVLTGKNSSARQVQVQDWDRNGQLSFAQAFPGAREVLRKNLREARRNLQFLEDLLQSENPLLLLQRLEERRRELDVMVARATVQEAGARVIDSTVSSLRNRLAHADAERDELLSGLQEHWQLHGGLAHFGVVLAPLAESARQQSSSDQLAYEDFQKLETRQQLAVIDALLEHLQEDFPNEVSGAKHKQTKAIHNLRVLRLERDLDFDLVDLLAQQAADFPGLYLQEVTQRLYPNEVARMVVGSLSLPSVVDLEREQEQRERFDFLRRLLHRSATEEAEFRQLRDWRWSDSLTANERKGQDGIEKIYEPVLRGSRGYLQELEGGADGSLPLELLFSPPQNGTDIRLALDSGMIRAAEGSIRRVYAETVTRLKEQRPPNLEKALRQFNPEQQKVGFVIMDLHSGAVPVLASTPQVTRSELRRNYDELAEKAEQGSASPLRNRVFGGSFYGTEQPYPGSTFKPLIAAAALSLDPNAWNRRYICESIFTPPGTNHAISCDSQYGHGEIDMREALMKSCNIYFYQLGNDIGAAAIHDLAAQLGFDDTTSKIQGKTFVGANIGTGNELSSEGSLEHNVNYLAPLSVLEGDVLKRMRTAIGQDGVRASPLQMARLFGWLGSGELVRPQLVLEGGGASPARAMLMQPKLSLQTRERITEALSAVVYEQGGTAYHTAFPAAWQIVGKTGTAQIAGDIPTHAWFTGYFPADNPHYAFAILCENTGLHGGQIATYILKDFLATAEGAELLR